MKKFPLIVTFILAMIYSFGQVNVYHSFPDSNTVWVESNYYLNGELCWIYDNYNMYIFGDTTIGNYTYHKLYKNGHVSKSCPPPNPPPPDYDYYGRYWGAFRQDSINKKVYLYDDWNQRDTLAYDFNLNVGDELPQTFLNDPGIFIDTIDSVLVGNHYNKRFLVSNHPSFSINAEIIEGVGNSFGVFSPIMDYFESGSSFFCLQVNNETVYNTNPNYPCTVINRIEKKSIQSQISINPNPFSNVSIISINKKLNDATLTMYNELGQEVKCIKNITGQEIKLHRDNLPMGVYFIRLTQKNIILAILKIIIMN